MFFATSGFIFLTNKCSYFNIYIYIYKISLNLNFNYFFFWYHIQLYCYNIFLNFFLNLFFDYQSNWMITTVANCSYSSELVISISHHKKILKSLYLNLLFILSLQQQHHLCFLLKLHIPSGDCLSSSLNPTQYPNVPIARMTALLPS